MTFHIAFDEEAAAGAAVAGHVGDHAARRGVPPHARAPGPARRARAPATSRPPAGRRSSRRSRRCSRPARSCPRCPTTAPTCRRPDPTVAAPPRAGHRHQPGDVGASSARTSAPQADDERMVHTAHASAYHWGIAGDARQPRPGRVAVQPCVRRGRPGRAGPPPRRAAAWPSPRSTGSSDFDLAYAHEAMARALRPRRPARRGRRAPGRGQGGAGRRPRGPRDRRSRPRRRALVRPHRLTRLDRWCTSPRSPAPGNWHERALSDAAGGRAGGLVGDVPAGEIVEAGVVGEDLDQRQAAGRGGAGARAPAPPCPSRRG